KAIDVAHLLSAFPNARGKMTGKMEGELKIAGEIEHSLHPLEGLHGSGHLTVHNGRVPSLKFNANDPARAIPASRARPWFEVPPPQRFDSSGNTRSPKALHGQTAQDAWTRQDCDGVVSHGDDCFPLELFILS